MYVSQRFRRALDELKALHGLAIPLVIAQLASSAIGFADTLMAGHYSSTDLAAVALGNSLWMPTYLLMTGILLATTPKVAQYHGAKQDARIGPLVRQALWLALALGCSAAALLCSAKPVMHWMEIEPGLADLSMRYLRAAAMGFPAMALYYVLRCFSDGMGRTRPSMLVGLLGLALNIPLNYVFIYGKFGLTPLGGVGCGVASALVMWCMLAMMVFWVRRGPAYGNAGLFARFEWPRWTALRELIAIGIPIGIAIFAEASIFSVIALLIGNLGANVVASHQIALSFSSLAFMIPLSLGMAVTVRVGQALGKEAPGDARFAAKTGIATGVTYAVVVTLSMLVFRDEIARWYTTDPALLALAASLIAYAALYQISDAIQVTAAGALRGYQDTRITMLITLLAYWVVGLPMGYGLGLTEWMGPPSGPAGFWLGLLAGLTCAATMLGVRLHRVSRRRLNATSSHTILPS
ncbi:MATE family efflux transporter [Pseudomonas matsuisoli]|uniref:Multidrug-efflux transporter n=1 Tax=Pseudomonas matsuisoli TaxID=1515666 RepID=A0A917V111_9PSED|nr:MATE family efflux transporter [Pseudomonas matsuisoli]GGK06275.1 multidrug resistance protein PmpM [Pseudomonas matsuisoli]